MPELYLGQPSILHKHEHAHTPRHKDRNTLFHPHKKAHTHTHTVLYSKQELYVSLNKRIRPGLLRTGCCANRRWPILDKFKGLVILIKSLTSASATGEYPTRHKRHFCSRATHSRAKTHTHTDLYTYIHIHTYILTHTYTQRHILTHTYTNRHILTHTYSHTLTHSYTHMHTYRQHTPH